MLPITHFFFLGRTHNSVLFGEGGHLTHFFLWREDTFVISMDTTDHWGTLWTHYYISRNTRDKLLVISRDTRDHSTQWTYYYNSRNTTDRFLVISRDTRDHWGALEILAYRGNYSSTVMYSTGNIAMKWISNYSSTVKYSKIIEPRYIEVIVAVQ